MSFQKNVKNNGFPSKINNNGIFMIEILEGTKY